jgi:hypothetical protein
MQLVCGADSFENTAQKLNIALQIQWSTHTFNFSYFPQIFF